MKTIEERAEHEVELIEQDENLTDEEKRQMIKEVYEELQEYEKGSIKQTINNR